MNRRPAAENAQARLAVHLHWRQGQFQAAGEFFGIDFDDRGRLYVLERRFTLGGFSSRITARSRSASSMEKT